MSNNRRDPPEGRRRQRRGAVGRPGHQRAGDPRPRGEAGVSEVAAEIGVHKSTAFRLLGALEARGLVEQDQDRGKYRLGFGIAAAGRRGHRPAGHHPAGPPGLRAARRASSARPSTSRCCRTHYAVNVDQVHGPAAVAAHNWVGQLTPLHATSSGKVLLAHLEPEARDAPARRGRPGPLHRRTPSPPARCSTQQLESALSGGYATTFEEYENGLNAMAAPDARPHRHGGGGGERLRARLPADKSGCRTCSSGSKGGGARLGGPDGPPRLTGLASRPARPVRRRGPPGRAPTGGTRRCGARSAPGRRPCA